MDVAPRRPMTVAEFLDWEERQPTKYEFDGLRPVGMVGVTVEHSSVQANLLAGLTNQLRGKPCRAHGSDVKIRVAGRIRYPDALVVCTPVPRGTTVVSEPVVVFEILSPSSEHTDLVLKNEEYRATQSIQHHVVLEQTNAGALVFSRKGEDWVSEVVSGADGVLRLLAIGVEMRLAEVYEGIDLPPEQDRGREKAV